MKKRGMIGIYRARKKKVLEDTNRTRTLTADFQPPEKKKNET